MIVNTVDCCIIYLLISILRRKSDNLVLIHNSSRFTSVLGQTNQARRETRGEEHNGVDGLLGLDSSGPCSGVIPSITGGAPPLRSRT
jgi:hypothetical protein